MDDLSEKLLPRNNSNVNYLKPNDTRNQNRLSLMPYKFQPIQQSSFEFQTEDDFHRKQYYSIVQEPQLVWNSEQILQRSLLLQQQKPQQPPSQLQQKKVVSQSIKSQTIYKSSIKPKVEQSTKRTSLNHRLFLMKSRPRFWIYCYNYFFNVLFRVGLVILLVELIIEGDGDQNQEEQKIFIKILLGLEGLVTIFYFLALTKFLYTKSCDISVYFQKEFYEMPYSEIHMLRIMRKHFTFNKIMSNLWRMINPFTKFSKDIKIAFMRQQIYKRIEMMIVFVPLFIVFLIGTPWFDRTEETTVQFDVKLLMAIIVCMQGIHIILHYLFVYIFS